jgi:heat shock protein HslJ
MAAAETKWQAQSLDAKRFPAGKNDFTRPVFGRAGDLSGVHTM